MITKLKSRVEIVSVYGKSLEHNLLGDSPLRPVYVYLPPGYDSSNKRYPVLYFLHGFQGSAGAYFSEDKLNLQHSLDNLLAQDAGKEMIIVVPGAESRYKANWYLNSEVGGDWEHFITEDIVPYIDKNYRTIPERASRGIGGHSVGGYGAFRTAMLYPDMFSSLYAMSPTHAGSHDINQLKNRLFPQFVVKNLSKPEETWDWPPLYFMSLAVMIIPDASNKNKYIKWPMGDSGWNSIQSYLLASMVDSYSENLTNLNIKLDIGSSDGIAPNARQLNNMMNELGVNHIYEEYEGTHSNKLDERFDNELFQYFSTTLAG